jgi:hypothetical protein
MSTLGPSRVVSAEDAFYLNRRESLPKGSLKVLFPRYVAANAPKYPEAVCQLADYPMEGRLSTQRRLGCLLKQERIQRQP